MQFIFVILVVLISGCGSTSRVPEPTIPAVEIKPATGHLIKFSRYISVETCNRHGRKCAAPVIREVENANVVLTLEPFARSYDHGLTAVDHYNVLVGKVPIYSEIRISKTDDGYYVYMMLKSGIQPERNGRIKTFKVSDMSKLTEVAVEDDLIAYKGGTLRAQLVMGPPLQNALDDVKFHRLDR